MSRKKLIIILFVIIVLMAVIPLATIHDSEFGGADGAAEDVIADLDPDYEPWAESIIELPGGETESLLFCLQAAIGAVIIGFGFGYYVGKRKRNEG